VKYLTVSLRDEESFDGLLRRFNREVMNSGILTDIRRKRFFVTKGEQGRIDARKGRRRARIRQLRSQGRESQ
jgi:small subunit ribosomal protein S21